jgi:hypothetical protein
MRIAVAVPCTDRKRGGRPEPEAMLRNVPVDLPVAERAGQWVDQLLRARGRGSHPTLADLYVGPGWTASLQLIAGVTEALRWDGEGLVVSAGLGLQRLGDRAAGWPRYSATFASGHPDSVTISSADPARSSVEWWSMLGRSEALGGTTFAELASSLEAVLVVASAPYLRAASEDLMAAHRRGMKVVAFTSSTQRLDDLDEVLVRIDARARSVVPASDARATADFVAHVATVLREDLLDVTSARAFVERTLEGRVAPPRPRGATAQPEEVRDFIEAELRKDVTVPKGRLLRRWRDGGRAFEQKRFGALYDEVASAVRGGSSGGGGRPHDG